MNTMQEEMWDALCELSGEQVMHLITDWLGLQILDEGFRKFLGDEGYMPEVEEEDDEEKENDDEEAEEELDDFYSFCNETGDCDLCKLNRPGVDCEQVWKFMKEEERHALRDN